MKVAYVTATMPYGPGEEFLISEVRELIKQNVDLTIVPRSYVNSCQQGDVSLTKISVPFHLLSFIVLVDALFEFMTKPLKCFKALKLVFNSNNPKILLYNFAVFPKGLWLSRLVTRKRVDHIHAHWASTTSSMALVASIVSGVPWSLTAHRGDIVLRNLLKIKFENASFVRFISESGIELARSCGVDLSKIRHELIHMGVQLPDTFIINKKVSEVPLILCPASLLPVKGHKHLLHAISILKERQVSCLLQLAGEGILHDDIKKEIELLGIGDMAQLLGQVSHDNILNLYKEQKVDLVVLPSIDLGEGLHEGIPVALIEAMGYGVPVISTRTGGIPELLYDGAGMLVPPEDHLALANAIQTVMENDSVRYSLIQNGRNRVMDQFAVENVVDKLVSAMKIIPNNM